MNNYKDKDFIDNSIKLKCSCTYQWSAHSKQIFAKDENGNTVEDWELSVSKQKEDGKELLWLCLIAKNKAGENITQIDFDNISKQKLKEFIKDLVEVYKYNFETAK